MDNNSNETVNENRDLSVEEAFKIYTKEPEAPKEDKQEVEEPIEEAEQDETVESDEGNEQEEVNDESETESEEPILEVDGEKFTAARIKELKAQSMMHKDYTQKTQALAEQRKSLEEEFNAVKADRERYSKGLEAIMMKQEPLPQIDWDALYEQNPQEYAVVRERYRQIQEERNLLQSEYDRIKSMEAEEVNKQNLIRLQEEKEKLKQAIPEWMDEKVAKKELDDIIQKAASYYNSRPEELSQISDHRVFLMLRDAIAFREAKNNKENVVKQVQSKPKVTLKGNSAALAVSQKDKAKQDLKNRLKKTGRIEDAFQVYLNS